MPQSSTQFTVIPSLPKKFVTQEDLDALYEECVQHEDDQDYNEPSWYFYGDESFGDNDRIVEVFQRILARIEYPVVIRIEAALTCSKMIPGSFGGFACVITKDEEFWYGTSGWMYETMNRLSEDGKVKFDDEDDKLLGGTKHG